MLRSSWYGFRGQFTIESFPKLRVNRTHIINVCMKGMTSVWLRKIISIRLAKGGTYTAKGLVMLPSQVDTAAPYPCYPDCLTSGCPVQERYHSDIGFIRQVLIFTSSTGQATLRATVRTDR